LNGGSELLLGVLKSILQPVHLSRLSLNDHDIRELGSLNRPLDSVRQCVQQQEGARNSATFPDLEFSLQISTVQVALSTPHCLARQQVESWRSRPRRASFLGAFQVLGRECNGPKAKSGRRLDGRR
jgi:hypothetical protein